MYDINLYFVFSLRLIGRTLVFHARDMGSIPIGGTIPIGGFVTTPMGIV